MAGPQLHAPMHSTSSKENRPSGVVILCPMPSVSLQCSMMAAARAGGEHAVVGDHVAHFQLAQADLLRDVRDRLVRQIAELVLREQQHWNEEGALSWVLLHFFREETIQLFGDYGHQRSISPSTMSMLPMAATTSAIRRPSHILGSACKLAKDGARMCTR